MKNIVMLSVMVVLSGLTLSVVSKAANTSKRITVIKSQYQASSDRMNNEGSVQKSVEFATQSSGATFSIGTEIHFPQNAQIVSGNDIQAPVKPEPTALGARNALSKNQCAISVSDPLECVIMSSQRDQSIALLAKKIKANGVQENSQESSLGNKKTTKNISSYQTRGKNYALSSSNKGFKQYGIASWYGPGFHGRKTANGERFNMNSLTAAHKTLPIGTRVRVTNLNNGKSVVVRINDRGPFRANRIIDLSYKAAMEIGIVRKGLAKVSIESL